jgi:hypothetical protein
MIFLNIGQMFSDMVGDIIAAIPSVIAAIIIILIGYGIGIVVGKAANKIIERLGIEKGFDKTSAGQAFRNAGLDLSNFVGAVLKAFITILAIILAIQILNVGGTIGTYLGYIANYLPRLLGGMLKPMFPEAKAEIADMLKNLLLIGLIAFILLLALDLLLLSGETIYPLILGFVLIGAGVALTDGLIKSITDDHEEFRSVAGYAKFVLYSIFLVVGAGAIFATFPNVTAIIANIAWAFAIALAIILIPIVYAMAKKMSKEVS